ncbi:hypothetical protein [Algoriphagus boritolerans]|uniref:hypothetical protein n=1 Tax=Algoriphagus boritolerans TaxID=308111 RepID=UPI002FCE59F0
MIFQSYEDGWQHLYSMDILSGKIQILTPGDYMIEQVKMSSDRKKTGLLGQCGSRKGRFR